MMSATDLGPKRRSSKAAPGGAVSGRDYAETRRRFAARRIAWRRRGLGVLVLFSLGALVLAGIAPVRPLAIAPGALTTDEDVVILKDFSGGGVAEIFVTAGQRVEVGAPLLAFDAEETEQEIRRLRQRRAHLLLRRERYDALLREAPFAPHPAPPLVPPLRSSHLLEALRQVEAERAESDNEAASSAAEIAEARAEAAAARASIMRLSTLVAAYREQHAMAAQLETQGVGARRTALDAKARLAEAQARLAEMQGRKQVALSAARRLESDQRVKKARRRARWSSELASAETEVSDIEARLQAAQARRERLRIAAPIAGRVLDIGAATAGDAIEPGGLVATIVPAGPDGAATLIAEIRISPRDAGQVREGATVGLEVSAFDRASFGEIKGALRSISPSTLSDAEGRPYYRGEVALDDDPSPLALAPGMTVQARISHGERTLLGYLLRPVARSLDAAFRER